MPAWQDLNAELDLWHRSGLTATLWWRDDDAIAATEALERLLALAARCAVWPALAVIPARCRPTLAAALQSSPEVTVLQHGWDHRNRAAAGLKKTELLWAGQLRALTKGLTVLDEMFGGRKLPVLVPPWNRIGPDLLHGLPGAGFRAISAFGPRRQRCPAPGLVQCNTHCDPVNWRHRRGFIGTEPAVGAVTAHLTQRRVGGADQEEATGLLTHHLVMDDETWQFVGELLARTYAHPAVRWLGGDDVFALQAATMRQSG